MYLDRISAAPPGTRLVARDSLVANHWEAVLSHGQLSSSASAWPSRKLVTESQCLAACWETARAAGLVDRNRLLLTPRQTDRLWQRVIDESATGQSLIASGGVSAWARSARRNLLAAGLAPGRQRGPDWQDDAAAFLGWNGEFERLLDSNGWVDAESLTVELNQLPPQSIGHDLLWLDPPPPSAEITRLNERWRKAGFHVDAIEPADEQATTAALIAGDPHDELDLAADWATRRLEIDPAIRIAVVVSDLDARQDEIERSFIDRLGEARVFSTATRSIGAVGIFGAALTAIELLSGRTDFAVLSRWLRSPFFLTEDDDSISHRAALEIALRRDPRVQLPFAEAWQRHGLRAVFERKLPATARRIDAALDRLARRATPTAWTGIWQACLDSLGWQGFELTIPDVMQSAWDNVWAAFSALTPIVGTVRPEVALDAFRQCVAERSIYRPMPLQGVHLMQRINQIGPGFAGAWISGFSADSFPEAISANPLLPWSVQTAHGMPGASPDATLAAARDELDRLRKRVPQAVFSCPRRTLEQPLIPSPLISGWEPATRSLASFDSPAARRIGARTWQQRIDPAPPLRDDAVPGGTRTLDLQAKSPAKAFCIARLRAEPLELPSRGIDPRLKGLLIHRALELLLEPGVEIASELRLDAALTAAFRDYIKPAGAVWHAQVGAERARIEQLLTTFRTFEAGRDPFTTVAVEHKTEIEFDAHRLRCRIDRIDSVVDGGELLIDYKTGRSVGARWFDDRLSECQLPIYAQTVPQVAGIATIRLLGNEVEYRGAGRAGLSLPGRVRTFDDRDWESQLARWRHQLKTLLDEFSAGDVRVRTDAAEHVDSHAMEHAGGAFAPLTRVGDCE